MSGSRFRILIAIGGAALFHGALLGLFFSGFRLSTSNSRASARVGDFQVGVTRRSAAPKARSRPATPTVSRGMQPVSTTIEGSFEPAVAVSPALLAALRSRIEGALDYPVSLRRRGIVGRVTLELHVEGDGSLLRFSIAQGSGHADLDRLAEQAVRKALPAKDPSTSVTKSWLLHLPVEFRLN